MKKILIATTALVMTAGIAAAEVAVTGEARMGVISNSANKGDEVKFSSRVRIIFTATGETDGGLAFGASTRADQMSGNGAPSTGETNGDSTVFISGAFGKITMGDVGGAADALVGQTDGVGYGPGGNDGAHEIGFVGTSKTAAYYEYATGALTFGLGLGQPADAGKNEKSVAVKYKTDAFSVALGYETFDNNPSTTVTAEENEISLLGSATFGAATVKAKYASYSIKDKDDSFSISATGTFSGVGVTAVYTAFGNTAANGAVKTSSTYVGLGASYDLGGGATVAGGFGQKNFDAAGVKDQTYVDLGVKFKF